ncbi:MAG: glucose 1-dehydrogenase [Nocardioidaceae bacterium]|jgi:threonine dehydrogenase-like Zn-dependent dehydrogenase|nr:glucose 1-dehydrogenase [Nocardioidaceae bacterium]
MRALTVEPGRSGSAEVEDRPAPEPEDDELLVQGLAIGVCGTDREIAAGDYGEAPEGQQRLVIGHESLGRVLRAPQGSGWSEGDLVAGVVRRPDPEPCGACAVGEFDMCRNGRYQERGIKGLDGYGVEQWTVPLDYAIHVDAALGRCGVLMEPTSVVAKGWEQVDRIGQRGWFEPRTALVTGAGPIGLLAALTGVQRGLDVHVLDEVTSGPKPDLVARLGATYHTESVDDLSRTLQPDVVIEATGVGSVVFDVIAATGPYGVVCLTGVSPTGRPLTIDAGTLNRELVLENTAVVGSVNANQRHYEAAAKVLAAADREWVERLITRALPLDRFEEALAPAEDDIKVVLTLDASGLS